MKGFRIFERFGFNLPKEIDRERSKYTVVKGYDEWAFEPKSFDWLNTKNGNRLADFNPVWQLFELSNNHVDTELK